MQGLSFREYLSLTTGQDFPVFSLEQIIKENERISAELAALVGVARQTLLGYFQYLDDSMLVKQLFRQARGLGSLEKPDKLYLENTNIMYMLNGSRTDIGNVRETFVYNQLKKSNEVLYSKESDFFVAGKYTFEVGGRNKKTDQIRGVEDSYIIADGIEFGTGRKIPVWLLGFMY